MRRLAALATFSLIALAACSRRAGARGDAGALSSGGAAVSASARPAPLGRKRLATPTAFELVPSGSGATLTWAPAVKQRGALFSCELDGGGRPKRAPEVVFTGAQIAGDISDLTSTWVGNELAVAWVERAGSTARVRAAWASNPSHVFELGAAWVAPRTARDNLALAARADTALVFARRVEAPCIESGTRGCFGFAFHELRGDRSEATGLPLSVPVPCNEGSTALAVVGSRFHYGVCTETERRPVTTMFTIERDREYARADPLLPGCEPAGMLSFDGAAWLVGRCEGGRRAVRLGREGEPAVSLDLRALRVECSAGSARLRAAGFELVLDEPRAGLQALLPEALAPRGARAVWSGHALLVAATLGDELRVTSSMCRGERLETHALEAPAP